MRVGSRQVWWVGWGWRWGYYGYTSSGEFIMILLSSMYLRQSTALGLPTWATREVGWSERWGERWSEGWVGGKGGVRGGPRRGVRGGASGGVAHRVEVFEGLEKVREGCLEVLGRGSGGAEVRRE